MDWQTFYGAMAGLTLMICLWSNDATLTKLAILLCGSWIFTLVVDSHMDKHQASIFVPIGEALIGLGVAAVGRKYQSLAALAVVTLIFAGRLVDLSAILNHWEATTAYIVIGNILFAFCLAIVGGTGVVCGLDRRRSRRADVRGSIGVGSWHPG